MGEKTKIEWTDSSWTPIRARVWEIQADGSGKERVGWHCEHVSEGCRNCYSERINVRLGTGREFKPGELYREEREGYHNGEVKVFLDEKMLTAPLRWRKPRRVFVCSMTDLFADFVADEWIDRVFAVMALCPQHTFQVLTKRPERMRDYMHTPGRKRIMAERVLDISDATAREAGTHKARPTLDHFSACFAGDGPFRNVWLGVSAERQIEADQRIPLLLDTPAAIRFVSLEPLLGSIDLSKWVFQVHHHPDNDLSKPETREAIDAVIRAARKRLGPSLDWVIVGGESGKAARPMHPDWARSLRDQCTAAGVPFFFKQWGEWLPFAQGGFHHWSAANVRNNGVGKRRWLGHAHFNDGARGPETHSIGPVETQTVLTASEGMGTQCVRLGKRAAGRLLDGRAHDEMPESRP